jgi:hypothetical protein
VQPLAFVLLIWDVPNCPCIRFERPWEFVTVRGNVFALHLLCFVSLHQSLVGFGQNVHSRSYLLCVILTYCAVLASPLCSRFLVAKVTNGLALFKAFFKHFREVDESIDQ